MLNRDELSADAERILREMQNKEILPKQETPEGLKEQRRIMNRNDALAIALNTLVQITEGKKQDNTFSEDPYSYEMRIRAAEILLNHVMAEKANQAWCPKCQAYCAPMEEVGTEVLKAKETASSVNVPTRGTQLKAK